MKKIFLILAIIYILSFFSFIGTYNAFREKYNTEEYKIIFQYLTSGFDDKLDKELNTMFNEREAQHMRDVRLWFNILNLLFVGSFIILFSFYKEKKEYLKCFFKSSIAIIVFIFILILIFKLSSFELLWRVFHYIFFPQGNWEFPSDSKIITLFPESFFLEFITEFIMHLTIISCVVIVFYILMRFLYSRRILHQKQ